MKEARDKLNQFIRDLSERPPHRRGARGAWPGSRSTAGDFAGAEATIAELASHAQGRREARPCSGPRCWHGKGKHDEAIAELDRLIASSPKGSARQRAAMLAKAESLAAMKKYKEAEALVRQVIKANPPEDAAVAGPGLQHARRLPPRRQSAQGGPRRLSAHRYALQQGQGRAPARACIAISLMFRQLKQDARADEFAQRLRTEYPRSVWNRASSSEER